MRGKEPASPPHRVGGVIRQGRNAPVRPGLLMAEALAGSWRQEIAPAALAADDLEAITARLLDSGGGALCWRRLRSTPLATTLSGTRLRDAYRLYRLHAVLSARALTRVVRALQGAGIDPVVAKGWAVARYYAEPGLRPYGDLDLFVGADNYTQAKAVVAKAMAGGDLGPPLGVDLQRYPIELDDRPFRTLQARTSLIALGGCAVRVLGAEDQVRMSLLHLLRHKGQRPLWLCDVGAMVEGSPGLDWDLVMWGSRRRAEWLACVLRLAHELLDARLETLPGQWQRRPLPPWLTLAIVRQWEDGMAVVPSRYATSYLRDPRGLRQGLYERWPNPLPATLRWGGYPTDAPRLPYQLRDIAWRLGLYAHRHLPLLRADFARRRQQERSDSVEWRRLPI